MNKMISLNQLRRVQLRAKSFVLDHVSQLADTTAQAVAEAQAASAVFTATFRMNGWSSSGSTWTQTVTCSGMKAAYNTSPAWVTKTGYQSTDEALHSALNQLNEGRLESMNGYIKATLYAPPPSCDVRIFVRRAI